MWGVESRKTVFVRLFERPDTMEMTLAGFGVGASYQHLGTQG